MFWKYNQTCEQRPAREETGHSPYRQVVFNYLIKGYRIMAFLEGWPLFGDGT